MSNHNPAPNSIEHDTPATQDELPPIHPAYRALIESYLATASSFSEALAWRDGHAGTITPPTPARPRQRLLARMFGKGGR